MTQVLVVDDHHLVRKSVRSLLERTAAINVVGEAEDGQEAIEKARELQPDVVVMDVSMPGMDGIAATKRIRAVADSAQVIILSMYGHGDLVRRALENGARGYLLKRSAASELLPAVQAAIDGDVYLGTGLVVAKEEELWPPDAAA